MKQFGLVHSHPERSELARRVREHLHSHILPFWAGPALDKENGGWMSWLSNDLKPDRSKPKGLIVHARILWAFSAASRVDPKPLYRHMAERAYEYLTRRFLDWRHGGAVWQLNDDGTVRDPSKKTYGQAFCIYALSEYYKAFGSKEALATAQEIYRLMQAHARDSQFGGYWEVRGRDWSDAGAQARLSEKDPCEKKSMNNHLHVLEAYTNLYAASGSAQVKDSLSELILLFLAHIIDPQTNHLHHFFDEQWRVRSETYTYGHDIEASWLLCEAGDVLSDASLQNPVRSFALAMAKGVLNQAVGPEGGIFYEGKAGQVIDRGLECWPQAEAVVGFVNAFELSGDTAFLTAANRVWTFIERHLADYEHGEWFWKITPAGKPDPSLPKVSEWKGPYHGTRACLETIRRLERLPMLIASISCR